MIFLLKTEEYGILCTWIHNSPEDFSTVLAQIVPVQNMQMYFLQEDV